MPKSLDGRIALPAISRADISAPRRPTGTAMIAYPKICENGGHNELWNGEAFNLHA